MQLPAGGCSVQAANKSHKHTHTYAISIVFFYLCLRKSLSEFNFFAHSSCTRRERATAQWESANRFRGTGVGPSANASAIVAEYTNTTIDTRKRLHCGIHKQTALYKRLSAAKCEKPAQSIETKTNVTTSRATKESNTAREPPPSAELNERRRSNAKCPPEALLADPATTSEHRTESFLNARANRSHQSKSKQHKQINNENTVNPRNKIYTTITTTANKRDNKVQTKTPLRKANKNFRKRVKLEVERVKQKCKWNFRVCFDQVQSVKEAAKKRYK